MWTTIQRLPSNHGIVAKRIKTHANTPLFCHTGRGRALFSSTRAPCLSSPSNPLRDDAVSKKSDASSGMKSTSGTSSTERSTQTKKGKTMAQLDEEMRLAMEGRAGDGGESGVELEDGKPVSMKRGVRDNMFRYI